jgi:hypothetical protein
MSEDGMTGFGGSGTQLRMSVKSPTVPEAKKLTMEDVFGEFDYKTLTRISKGMVIASGMPDHKTRCPIFKDVLPYKSVTVVCKPSQVLEVKYWLEYVHGGGSVSKIKVLPDNRVAIRSDYQCW